MLEEARNEAKHPFLKSKKFYVFLSLLYGFCAVIDIKHLFVATPHHRFPEWHWMIWNQIVASIVCIYICFEIWRSVRSRIEKTISIITMTYFALTVPSLIYSLGYDWFRVPQSQWEFAGLMSVAAILVFVRTFQVLRGRETPAEAR